MSNNRLFLTLLKLWFTERKGAIHAVVGASLICLTLLLGSLPKSIVSVLGIARDQVLDASVTGNKSKIAVKLQDGSMAHVAVYSPSQVKIGMKVCLIKKTSYLGTVHFSIATIDNCT